MANPLAMLVYASIPPVDVLVFDRTDVSTFPELIDKGRVLAFDTKLLIAEEIFIYPMAAGKSQ